MRVIHNSHIVLAFIAAAILMCIDAGARGNLPKELLESRRRDNPLERLLESPAANMDKIKVLYLGPGDGYVSMAADSIRDALGKPHGLEDMAALRILLADAIKAKALDANMPDRRNAPANGRKKLSSTVLDEILGEKTDDCVSLHSLVPPLLDDFTALSEKSPNGRLLKALMETMNSLLSDPRVTGKMSDSDKRKALETYIRSDKEPLAKCKPGQVAEIYRNLGFIDEMKRLCSVSPDGDETMAVLERKLGIAASAELADEAIACADRLLIVAREKASIPCHYDAVAAYARFRPKEALEKFKGKCRASATATVTMYRTACAADQYGDEASRRREWLDRHMDWVWEQSANGAAVNVDGTVNEAMEPGRLLNALAYELEASGCPEAALYVAFRILGTKALLGERRIRGTLQLVERCNKAIGRRDDTRKTFAACLEHKELDEAARRFATSRINAIDNKNENTKEK